jgi:uncharacterized repeat protein (TIGR01451 family)
VIRKIKLTLSSCVCFFASLVSFLALRRKSLLLLLTLLLSPAMAMAADWAVDNSNVGSAVVAAGANITYTVTVANNGTTPAPSTTLTLNITTANATFFSVAGLSCTGSNPVLCAVPALDAFGGANDSVVVTYVVTSTVQGIVTLSASVPTAGDTDPLNNAELKDTTVNAGADLALTLAGPTSAASGSTVTYVYTATNNGPDAANNFSFSIPAPTGLSNIVSPPGCTLSGITYNCTIAGPLANAASTRINFTGQISAAAGSTVTASGSVVAGTPADPIATNNNRTLNTNITAGSDLSIGKSRSPTGTLLSGTPVTFTLSPIYTGDQPTGTITVTDTIPSNYTVGTITGPINGWTVVQGGVGGRQLTFTKTATGGAGNNVTLGNINILVIAQTPGTGIINSTNISAPGSTDPTPGNNTANDGGATIVAPVVDLTVAKSGPSPALVVQGQNYSYTIGSSNIGNAPFFGTLELKDSVPTGLTVNSYTLNGWTCSPTPAVGPVLVTCSRVYTAGAPLAASTAAPNVVFNTTVTATGALNNSVVVSSPDANIADTNPGNNTAAYAVSGSLPGASADLRVIKTVSPATVVAGDVLTYTLEVVNAGPVASSNITLTDDLTSLVNSAVGPTGAGFISAVPTAGVATVDACTNSASSGTSRQLSCPITNLPVCTAGINCPKITVQVRPGGDAGTRSNSATAISSVTADPDLTNNTGSVNATVTAKADVTVAKSATPASVPAGQNLTYVVTATNVANGLSAADAVTITDTLPSNVTFVSATPSSGSCSAKPAADSTTGTGNNQVVCNLGTVSNGGQQTVTIVVRPKTITNGTSITNNVNVITTTPEVAGGLTNSASVVTPIIPPVLNLIIAKDDDINIVTIGDNVVYTITVTNQGPSASENIVVTETLPTSKLSYQSRIPPAGGSCTTGTEVLGNVGGAFTCAIPYLPAGQVTSFTVTMKGAAKGVAQNNVSLSSTETLAGFEDPASNTDLELTTVRTKADMQVVSKVATPATVNIRDNFNYVIRVRNNTGVGLGDADTVLVADSLPAGMELTGAPTVAIVSGTASATTCTAIGLTGFNCDLGTVGLGSVLDITVPVQLVAVTSAPQTFNNTASVTTGSFDTNGGDDPNAGNNFNSGSVTVNSSSISGKVFADFDHLGAFNAPDVGIVNVPVRLQGTTFDGALIDITINTDAAGNYSFIGLPQGVYRVTEGAVPALYTDGLDTAGTSGGTATNDVISNINLASNTAATGYLFAEFPVPRIGVAKAAAGGVVNNGDGTYNITFNLNVGNYGTSPLNNVQVTDDLTGTNAAGKFGTYVAGAPAAGQYTIVGSPTISNQLNGAALTAAAFTGSAAGTALLVPATSNLPNFGAGTSSSAQVSFTVRFFPTTGGPFNNTAAATGKSPFNETATDNSVDSANPDGNIPFDNDPTNNTSPTVINLSGQTIALAKAVGAVVQTGVNKFRVPYSLIVANPSTTTTATFVQITDSLNATFPTASNITISAPAAVSGCTGTVLVAAAPAFNGRTQTKLLDGNQNLQPSERCTITFTTEVTFAALPTTVQFNQALATTATAPGGTVISSDLSDDGVVPDPNGNGTANDANEDDPTPVSFSVTVLSSISGKVWLDSNHDRLDNDGAASPQAAGFIVEVLNAAGATVGRTVSAANGTYSVRGLFPSTAGDPTTYYTVRFTDPVTGRVYGNPVSQDPTPARNGTVTRGLIDAIQLAPGVNTINQNLPLDPSGVVYDAVTRAPVAGATVTLQGPSGGDVPGTCLVGGVNSQTTGAFGTYQFLLLSPTPPGCPGSGVYTIKVVQPGNYLPPASVLIPPTAGPLTPVGLGVEAIQAQSGPPTGGQPTTYFFSFNLTIGGTGVVNNHIPLDPILGGAIIAQKSTPLVNVSRGDLVPYTLTFTNTLATPFNLTSLLDTIPPGFKYRVGTAKLDGVPKEPVVNGRDLTWANVSFAGKQKHIVQILLVVGSGVTDGEYVNRTVALNAGNAVSNTATATVRVVPDPTFDCSDLIGKVFDDKNANGYQDAGEPGIPNVRLATVNGLLVTTDAEGRFHVTCAAVPLEFRGSNFLMKLDERTLPSGYRVTTENPRDVRLTRGKLSKLNFGAAIHRVVRIELTDDAFKAGSEDPKAELAKSIADLPAQLRAKPSVVRFAYALSKDDEKLAKNRMKALRNMIEKNWKDMSCCYALQFEEEIFQPLANTKGGVK